MASGRRILPQRWPRRLVPSLFVEHGQAFPQTDQRLVLSRTGQHVWRLQSAMSLCRNRHPAQPGLAGGRPDQGCDGETFSHHRALSQTPASRKREGCEAHNCGDRACHCCLQRHHAGCDGISSRATMLLIILQDITLRCQEKKSGRYGVRPLKG